MTLEEIDSCSYKPWIPRIVPEDDLFRPHVENAAQLWYEEFKATRPPCRPHGRPSVIYKSTIPVPSLIGTWYEASRGINEPLSLGRARAPANFAFIVAHLPELPETISIDNPDVGEPPDVLPLFTNERWRRALEKPDADIRIARLMSFFIQALEPQICEVGSLFPPFKKERKGDMCPKCGRIGSFGTIPERNARVCFHKSSNGQTFSCYLGVIEPKRKLNPLVKCEKCGMDGRLFTDKRGYRYVRHKEGTCYLGE